MKFSTHEETPALLTLLALGNREIEQGKFRPASEVFEEMDKDNKPPRGWIELHKQF